MKNNQKKVLFYRADDPQTKQGRPIIATAPT